MHCVDLKELNEKILEYTSKHAVYTIRDLFKLIGDNNEHLKKEIEHYFQKHAMYNVQNVMSIIKSIAKRESNNE